MSAIVRLFEYFDYKNLKPTPVEKDLELSNGYLGKMLKRQASIGSDIVEKIVYFYPDLNTDWLITGRGNMIISENENIITSDLVSIPVVDIQVAAGSGAINSENLEIENQIQLPTYLIKQGYKYYCVRVKGHSMAPTLQDSSYLIIRLLEKNEWQNMPDEHVYVVVDNEGHAYVKRIRNRFNKGFIVCTSDNTDKANFPNFNLMLDEIQVIWHGEWYFTAKMDNINKTYYSELSQLKDDIENIKIILGEKTLNEFTIKNQR